MIKYSEMFRHGGFDRNLEVEVEGPIVQFVNVTVRLDGEVVVRGYYSTEINELACDVSGCFIAEELEEGRFGSLNRTGIALFQRVEAVIAAIRNLQ